MGVDLYEEFRLLNEKWFGGALPPIDLHWNSRLKTSAGRFYPGEKNLGERPKIFSVRPLRPPVIEVALYLQEEGERALELIRNTLGHEMIHYWLWVEGKPYGHTPLFMEKMREMGVYRYNPVPRTRDAKYIYFCLHCEKKYPARKIWRNLACAKCCDEHSDGKFDRRFALKLLADL